MIAWIKIALRNLIKNARRSLITALAIALGFAAVNLFSGFTEYMYTGNREMAIYERTQGHLTIFKKGFLEKSQLDPARYLLTAEEINIIKKVSRDNTAVVYVTPQLMISGLLTDGKISTVFLGQGVVPSAMDAFFDRITVLEMAELEDQFEGKRLDDNQPHGVGLANGLARLLDLKLGSDAVAFTNTVSGQLNALDVEVFNLFNTSSDQMNDKFMIVPFNFAQMLYDTDGADRIAILLSKTELTEPTRNQLETEFSKHGLDLEIKTWKEMSEWYRRVKEMYDVIFLYLFSLVSIIVVMSVINTMSMVVLERTREIGTLRALGLKRNGVLQLFAIECGLLGFIGTLWGLLLTIVGWWLVNLIRFTWVPPGITYRVPIRIEFVPESMVSSFLLLLTLCVIVSVIPARRAARGNIVDALGHV
jgi:putative ABC transport system permease protein